MKILFTFSLTVFFSVFSFAQMQPTVHNPTFDKIAKSEGSDCSCSGWINKSLADQGESSITDSNDVVKFGFLESDGIYQEVAGESSATSTLTSGDIVVISIQTDSPDEFRFVPLVDLEAGTTISFTDNGWSTDAFRANEGNILYTVPSGGVTKGTNIIYNQSGTDNFTNNTSNISLSAGGDQILVYQGEADNPTFIFAASTHSTVWGSGSDDSNQTDLPSGLTDGVNAITLGAGDGPETEFDNIYYSGIISGTKEELLSAVANVDNWTGSQTVAEAITSDFTVTETSSSPVIEITAPTDGATLASTTASVTVSVSTTDFAVGAIDAGLDGHIHWSIQENSDAAVDQAMKYDTNDETISVTAGNSYTVFMELRDNSHQPLSPEVNTSVNFSVEAGSNTTDETPFAIEYEINSGIEGQQSNANGLIEIGNKILSLENIYGNNFNQTDLKIRNKSDGELLHSEILSNSYDDYYNMVESVSTEDSLGYYFVLNKSGYDNDSGENITSSLIYRYNSEGLTLLNTLSNTSTNLLVFDSGNLFLIDSSNLKINMLNLSDFSVDQVLSLNFDNDNFTNSKVFKLDETTFILRGDINSGNYNNDVFLSKFDLNAQIFWEKVIDGNRDDRINAVKLINNEIFLCGKSLSYDGIFADEYGEGIEWGDEPFKSNWIMKLNSSGDILWSKLFNPSWYQQSYGQFYDIFEADSFILLGGSAYNNYDYYSGFENHYNEDLYTVKLDFEGNVIWEKTYGGFNNQQFISMGVVNNQIIYTTNLNRWNFGGGFYYSYGDVTAEISGKFDNPLYLSGGDNNQQDIWILSTNYDGEILWNQFYGGERYDLASNTIYNSDRMYVNATTKSIDYDVGSLIGIQDSWFFKLRPNNRPEGIDDNVTILEDSELISVNVIDNDTDIDGDNLVVTEIITNGSGTININSNGTSIDYTPAADFNGTEVISYTVSDGEASDSPVLLNINVTAVNDSPEVIDDTQTVFEDSNMTQIDVLSNDTDVDEDDLVILNISYTGTSSVELSSNGLLINYIPAADFNGSEEIEYTVSDGELTNTGVLTITVTPVNDAPVTLDDTLTIEEDSSLINKEVALNDTDIDGDSLFVNEFSYSGEGTVAINSNTTSIDYTPASNFNGVEEILYTVSDGELTDTGILTITVTPVNDAPESNNDTIELNEGEIATLLQNNESNLLQNDTDLENDVLTAILLESPAYGVLNLNSDGTFSYEHDGSETTSDNFTYKSNDGDLDSNISTVSIIINPINDNSPSNITLTITDVEENISNTLVGQIIVSDIDLPNDNHIFEIISGTGDTDNEKFSIEGNNLYLVTGLDFETQPTLSIRVNVTDQNNNSFEDNLMINVIDVNDINITTEVLGSYCSGDSGSGSVTITSINDVTGSSSFSWSALNGGVIPTGQENSQNISGLSAGTYELNLTNSSFNYTQQFEVGLTPQYDQLSICYVTSDETNFEKNRIFINNQGNYNVDYYEILRESSVANEYESIGQIDASENSFLDDSSNNMSQSYSYKVRLMDNCGSNSTSSDTHKTILLQSSISVSNSVNLNWSDYEGTGISSYDIFRKENDEDFQIIGSVSSNNNSYNDSTADVNQNNYEYYISISVDDCLTGSRNSSEIKSNRQSLGTSLSTDNIILDDELLVYPNPTNNKINIKIKGDFSVIKSEVFNNLGQQVLSTKELIFSVNSLSSSVYYIKIFTSKGLVIKRFIRE
jgi:VCBS repeat-containing protein